MSATLDFTTKNKVVFAAMSKKNFFLREHVIRFVLNQGHTPTCAFMMFSYFLLDTVNRDALISANNDLIRRSDELWVFGDVSSGVKAEVGLAQQLGRTVRYYACGTNSGDFVEISPSQAKAETGGPPGD